MWITRSLGQVVPYQTGQGQTMPPQQPQIIVPHYQALNATNVTGRISPMRTPGKPEGRCSIRTNSENNSKWRNPSLYDRHRCYTTLNGHASAADLSSEIAAVMGFSGQSQYLQCTKPWQVTWQVDHQSLTNSFLFSFLYSESCPINLLGRDMLTK